MLRKIVDIEKMVEFANYQLARTDEDATKDFKSGVSSMIEKLLLSANVYNGFTFLNNEDSASETLGFYSRKYHFKDKLK